MGLFRTMLDEGGEVTEIPALDAQGAAEARAETAFHNLAGEIDQFKVYVEDDDGEVLAFDVEVEMVPSFDASESDDEAPASVVAAFKAARKGGA
jgi:hypothetical protein